MGALRQVIITERVTDGIGREPGQPILHETQKDEIAQWIQAAIPPRKRRPYQTGETEKQVQEENFYY